MDCITTRPSPHPLHSQLASWPSCWVTSEIMTMSNDGLIYEIAHRMDADEIVEVLDLDMDVLLEALRDHIVDNRAKFNDYLEIDE